MRRALHRSATLSLEVCLVSITPARPPCECWCLVAPALLVYPTCKLPSREGIENRDWDVVIDVATYGPLWIRILAERLANRIKHYTFISSISVYRSFKSGVNNDEASPLNEYHDKADPYRPVTQETDQYGELKVLCEREALRQFPGRTLIVRPGYVAGPGEDPPRLLYWARRMDQGGEVLAPGDPLMPVQIIDVRDIAAWVIRLAEHAQTGVYNTVGPARPMGMAEMLGAVRDAISKPATLTWVPTKWLVKHKVEAEVDLPIWYPREVDRGMASFLSVSNDKARSAGLTFRPIGVTAVDSLAWRTAHPPGQRELAGRFPAGWGLDRERLFLAAWHAERKRRGEDSLRP
jgi:2'-hydroxyisoflavone reductase